MKVKTDIKAGGRGNGSGDGTGTCPNPDGCTYPDCPKQQALRNIWRTMRMRCAGQIWQTAEGSSY